MGHIIKLPVNPDILYQKQVITSKELQKEVLSNLIVSREYTINIISACGWCEIFWSDWAIHDAEEEGLHNRIKAFVFLASADKTGTKPNKALLKYAQLYKMIYIPFDHCVYLVTEQTAEAVPVANLAYALGLLKRNRIQRSTLKTQGNAYAFRFFKVTVNGDLKVLKDTMWYVENGEGKTKEFEPMYFAEHSIADALKH